MSTDLSQRTCRHVKYRWRRKKKKMGEKGRDSHQEQGGEAGDPGAARGASEVAMLSI